MNPKLFISYSRQCIPFVDDLVHRLEKRGFMAWLDYRSLVPGRLWEDQIRKGLEGTDVLLLVVSRESMASRSVEREWRHFLEQGRRIILLIFQAAPLPSELASLEWVDFRGFYPVALGKLFRLIDSPVSPTTPAPQSGFKAPLTIWLAGAVSLVTAIYSLFAAWTFLIPWVLVPLPVRVFKRNFNLSQVQTALWTLPVALFFSLGLASEFGIYNDSVDFDYVNVFSLYNLGLMILFLQIFFVPLLSIFLLLILHSPAMQRWGQPDASLTKFANIYHPDSTEPRPVRFYIDHAPEDLLIARELSAELTKYGHSPAEAMDLAENVLVLVSRYKTDTQADPEKKVVYPVLIQRVKIPEKLSRLQWIDFRKGVRNLEAIAQLLPQPERMLAAVGVRPGTSGERARPNIVRAVADYLIVMAMVDVGSYFSYLLELQHLQVGVIIQRESFRALWPIFMQLFLMALALGLTYFLVTDLTERRGRLASAGGLLLGLAGLLILFTWQAVLGDDLESLFNRYGIVSGAIFSNLPLFFFLLGGLVLGIAVLFRWKDLYRWFPARGK